MKSWNEMNRVERDAFTAWRIQYEQDAFDEKYYNKLGEQYARERAASRESK